MLAERFLSGLSIPLSIDISNAHFRCCSVKGIGETRAEDERDWYDRFLNENMLFISHLVSQSVKEVLQSLVDDGLVQGDKIGSSNCEPTIVSLYARVLSFASFLEFPFSTRSHGESTGWTFWRN